MFDSSNVFEALPVLPVADSILFPNVARAFEVELPCGIVAVEIAYASKEKRVFVVAAKESAVQIPRSDQLFSVGTVAQITRLIHGSRAKIALEALGLERAVVEEVKSRESHLRARIRRAPVVSDPRTARTEALERVLFDLAAKLVAAKPDISLDLRELSDRVDGAARLYMLASVLGLDLKRGQSILQAETYREALELLVSYLVHEAEVLSIKDRITTGARAELGREQREYLLRQQLRIIRRELGEDESELKEIHSLWRRLEDSCLPQEARARIESELSRLERINPSSPEHNVIRSYVEYVVGLPWAKPQPKPIDLSAARALLHQEHYGLDDVNARILEHLAVLRLNSRARAPLLCFEGPPGVGKTSLGQSIARVLGRKFERVCLGGLHDEAELRGHRRTYVGAMPGRIIQAVRRAGVGDPVLLLDELDKIGRDFRADPCAALLEILDPELNAAFRDNYVEIPFDLSGVVFLCTANSMGSVPRALADRLEVLRLSGYSEEEKVQIARRFLIPKHVKESGLAAELLALSDEGLREIIARYTREAGVRQLERSIARLARKLVLDLTEPNTLQGVPFGSSSSTPRAEDSAARTVEVGPGQVETLLGPPPFFPEPLRRELPPGVAVGLAWTETGGEILYVETAILPHRKGLTLTGHLGEIMQESAYTAQSYVWSKSATLGIDAAHFRNAGVHLHVPAGSIPKDGPSAGITMVAALSSAYTNRRWRSDTAMTGEITLSGLVLPVGGVKEKVLAARRAGLRHIILPRGNSRDLKDLPAAVRADLHFHLIDCVDEMLQIAFPSRVALLASR